MTDYRDVAEIGDAVPTEAEAPAPKRFQLPEKIKTGDRHVTMFKLLRSQKARGLSFDAAVAACDVENKARCDPPLRAKELEYQRWWDEADQPTRKAERTAGILTEFTHYFITQLGSQDGGRLITMVGCDREFPPSFQTFSAFAQYYLDTPIKTGKRWTTRAKLWLQNKAHRKYTDVQFLPPPLVAPPTVLNLWQGFAVAPDPDPFPERRCPLFLRHVREVICGGEVPDVAEFHLDVLAAKVQRPAELTEVAVVYRGPQGIGKNSVTEYLTRIFGRHAATVDKHQLVTGRFNAVLSSKLVLVMDEAMWPGHKEFIGALKSLITSRKLIVERKGFDPISESNFVQTFVLTNGDWAWPAELDDRRAFVLDVLPTHKGDMAYFTNLYDEMSRGGPAALLALLQQRRITHELRLVPHTKARDQQVSLTDDDPVRSMWFDMLQRGTTWPEGEDWTDFISTKDLQEYYVEWCRAARQKPLPQKMLLEKFHAMLPKSFDHPKQRRVIDRELVLGARRRGGWPRDKDGDVILPTESMRRGTILPGLVACRTHYATHVEAREIDWPIPEGIELPTLVYPASVTRDTVSRKEQ